MLVPEAAALLRWQAHDFVEVERAVARKWRADLGRYDPARIIGILKNILPTDTRISNLEQLKDFIDAFCDSADPHVLQLGLGILGVPSNHQSYALRRWKAAGRPALPTFAPYTTHCFKVDLLYHLGILRGFISGERASNRADMAYLYYLPFASVFVSGDKLHQRTVPLFAGSDQSYISHDELKEALRELDDHYSGLPDEIKQFGVMSFAAFPPLDLDSNSDGDRDREVPRTIAVTEQHGHRPAPADAALRGDDDRPPDVNAARA